MGSPIAHTAMTVIFHAPKAGSTEAEWEDGAGYDPGDPALSRPARFVVVDGATEAYDAIRWVGQLVTSFVEGGAPGLDPAGLDNWFGQMQQRWVDEAPETFANYFEETAFRESGSFATFLGCEVYGLGGGQPYWSAAALGDAVLFHVRNGRVVAQFPRLPEGFGINPDGISTQPSQRGWMRDRLEFERGSMLVGDLLFVATDALADWLIRQPGNNHWRLLSSLEHPGVFRRFVADQRSSRELKNDDVTLLRVEIAPHDADVLVECR